MAGSVSIGTLAQAPVPQVWQLVQGVAQQMPATQWSLAQSVFVAHPCPFTRSQPPSPSQDPAGGTQAPVG